MLNIIELVIKRRLLILLVIFLLATSISAIWLNSSKAAGFRSEIKESILRELVKTKPVPSGATVDIIYVLGGNQESLEYKYNKTAELYKCGVSKKIWILDRPGTTGYNHMAGRNFTNNEWSLFYLGELGVPKDKIEIIKVDGGFFGTLSEAKHISQIVGQRGYSSILLISQYYHAERAHISFKKYLPTEGFSLYIQNSNESHRLYEVIFELIKLKSYKNWLLNTD